MATNQITNAAGKKVPITVAISGYTATLPDGTVLSIKGAVKPSLAQWQAVYDKLNPPVVVTPPVVTPPSDGSFTAYVPSRVVSSLPVTQITWAQLQSLKNVSDKNYQLAAGNYSGQAAISNCKNIFLDLSLATFKDAGIPVFEFSGNCSSFTIAKGTFANMSAQIINYQYKDIYNGSNSIDDFTIQDCSITNCAQPLFMNNVYASIANGFPGVFRRFKFIYNTATNCPKIGNFLYLYHAENFEICNNTINAVNSQNTDHNAIFAISGNGRIDNNRATNGGCGMLFRVNPFIVTGENTTFIAQNNLYVNTTKYGAMEVQITPDQKPYVKPVSSITINRNTAGDLNSTHNWSAALLDIYPCATTINVTNNLGWNMYLGAGIAVGQDMIDPVNTDGDIIKTSNNHYFPVATQAVGDQVSFKSVISGVGAL